MSRQKNKQFKTGSATFYTVVIACLLLSVIVTGFSFLVIRERTNNINNSLSDSAYDAALAGVEDAKLALSEYYFCANTGHGSAGDSSTVNCDNVKTLVNDSSSSTDESKRCGAVQKILGRNATGGEAIIKTIINPTETMTQAYTCVQIFTSLKDYRGTISNTSPTRLVPLYRTDDPTNIDYVDVSWYSVTNASSSTSGVNLTDGTTFDNDTPIPPVLSVSFFQTDNKFNLSELDNTSSNLSARGTVWLVPSETSTRTAIESKDLANTNNHSTKNEPFQVKCSSNPAGEFYCTTRIYLPKSTGGTRDKDTPLLLLSLPYESPETDFSVVAYKSSGAPIDFKDAQIAIDSTGRANDIYSRVEARVEYREVYFPFTTYALDLGGDENTSSLIKY